MRYNQIMEEVNYAFAVSEFTETIDPARVFLCVSAPPDREIGKPPMK